MGKIKSINYSKVFSLGNYENEKIGVEIEFTDGDDPQKLMQEARNYVEFNHKVNGYVHELEKCQHIVNNPDDFTGIQVRRAQERINEIHEVLNDAKKLLS